MLNCHRYRGVSWVTLVAVVVSFQPWIAMAGTASTKRYTTIPAARSSAPAARSAPSKSSQQVNTTPAKTLPLPASNTPISKPGPVLNPTDTVPTLTNQVDMTLTIPQFMYQS